MAAAAVVEDTMKVMVVVESKTAVEVGPARRAAFAIAAACSNSITYRTLAREITALASRAVASVQGHTTPQAAQPGTSECPLQENAYY